MRYISVLSVGSSRSGKVVMLLILSMGVVFGMLAITLDGGRIQEERRRAQAAADAAALAAGGNLYSSYWTNQGLDPQGSAATAAESSAATQGYQASSVKVNIPPLSGTFAGQSGYVEVLVSSNLSATFGQVFSSSEVTVVGRSVARGQPMNIGLILLRSSGAGAFLNQSPAFALINSPLIVNSSDPAALDQESMGLLTAKRFDVTGGYVNPGSALIQGTLRTGVQPTPDPLLFLPIPETTGVPVCSAVPLTVSSPLPTILQPGIYQGGIHITNLASVVLQSGVYIMQGGGFHVDGIATVVGQEVMIYNTTSSSYAAGSITVNSLGKVVLGAPQSGTYQGINFFQDRSLSNPFSVAGAGLTTITGVVYAVGAPVTLTESAAVSLDVLGGGFVVDSMNVQGVGAININLGLNPPRVPDVRLVE